MTCYDAMLSECMLDERVRRIAKAIDIEFQTYGPDISLQRTVRHFKLIDPFKCVHSLTHSLTRIHMDGLH
jgi:hypothetical protein